MRPSPGLPRPSQRIRSSRVGSSFRSTPTVRAVTEAGAGASAQGERADVPDDTFWSPMHLGDLLAEGPASTIESLLGSGRDLWEDDESYERFLADLEEAKRTMKAQGRRDA